MKKRTGKAKKTGPKKDRAWFERKVAELRAEQVAGGPARATETGTRRRRGPEAMTLALNAGMRDAEIRGLQWGRMDLSKAYLTVGDSKTEGGEGRTIPLNSDLLEAMVEYSKWYTKSIPHHQAGMVRFPGADRHTGNREEEAA